MKTFRSILIAGVVAMGGILTVAPAFAVPPTAQFNPGYERRLKESRQYPRYYTAPVRPYHHRHYHHY
jgi:hypothetical protein